MKEALFYLVVLLANIIQGITGFAGTILAMPFSARLVGLDVAVPVLNVLGLLSGIYVFAGNRKFIDRAEIKRVLLITVPAVLAGILIRRWLSSDPGLLYIILGSVVTLTAVLGLLNMLRKRKETAVCIETAGADKGRNALSLLILAACGLVHGMFVCGGPLLISYLAGRIKDKTSFRATISTVWIFLNGIILVSQFVTGSWSMGLLRIQLISLPFLFAGMFIGGILYRRMSQKTFMVLTYFLLLVAGLSLFFK